MPSTVRLLWTNKLLLSCRIASQLLACCWCANFQVLLFSSSFFMNELSPLLGAELIALLQIDPAKAHPSNQVLALKV